MFVHASYAQLPAYTSLLLHKDLTENANAIIRLDRMEITIASQRQMDIRRCEMYATASGGTNS